MFFLEDIWLFIFPEAFRDRTLALPALLYRAISESMNAPSCIDLEPELCRDDSAAFVLKFIAMASILVSGVAGIAIPILGRHLNFLKLDRNFLVGAKAFAAGVILSTGFMHMLSAGSKALSSSCLPTLRWSNFPFSGFFAMFAALLTLFADFIVAQYVERKQGLKRSQEEKCQFRTLEAGLEYEMVSVEEEIDARHALVSQIIELGIVSHSAIIALTLGVSHSPCTIKPLIVALSFHQFFEGYALGGCIAKTEFDPKTVTIAAGLLAATTPIGIGTGTFVASLFNPLSSGVLVAEGLFVSLSAGILVYIALVDMIAGDFLSKRRRYNFRVQVVSYSMMFFGAGLMSLLAL